MIQDKIFFDEKDPTGVSYNTPFTVYGSYEGRLWSKTPSGTIKFYTQNSDLSVYATTGSNQFSGSQTVTGSLTVTGGITGTATTASYVEYTGVANKPALVSGSSQVTYSGLTGVPAGIVSSSTQIGGYGVFATTGSNQFNGSQAITGSLTVTGQVVAQTLNVQQVTSSIVYSSGSNIFGNSLGNTQQFTGSVSVTGSLAVAGVGTFSSSVTAGGIISTSGTGLNASVRINNTTSSTGKDWHLYSLNNGNFGLYNNIDGSYAYQVTPAGNLYVGNTDFTSPNGADKFIGVYGGQDASLILQDAVQLWELYVNDDFYITSGATPRLTINRTTGNVGIGTTSPIGPLDIAVPASGSAIGAANAQQAYNFSRLRIKHYTESNLGLSIGYAGANLTYIQACYNEGSTAPLLINSFGGNVGIGATSPATKLDVVGTVRAGVNTSYYADHSYLGINYNLGSSEIADNIDFKISGGGTFTTGGNFRFFTQPGGATPIERMRITSGGEVNIGGFGTIFPVLTVKGIASSPHIGSTWSVSANQDGTGRTIIGTAGQGRSMYFENNGDIVIPNNTLSVAGNVTANGFKSYSGTSSIASGATSTIHTMSDNGLYTVQVIVAAGSLIYSAAAIFNAHNSNAQYVKVLDLYDGPNVTLDNSGGAIRITNGGFSTFTWNWSITFQPF